MQTVIGTRGSKLALIQAQYVQKRLTQAYPEDEFVIKIIQTKGDRIQECALSEIGDKGLFVKEIEQELLDNKIHLAVHSMKDMPLELPEGLCFADAWTREDARDALVLREAGCLQDLKEHAVIGTGSMRRACQLRSLRPDLKIVNIRGNVDTRLAKMHCENMDGIVLAAAGLIRLQKEDVITQYLDVSQMVPAATQGQLALELRTDNTKLLQSVNALSDADAQRVAMTERLYLQKTGGGCHRPVGAYARILENRQIEFFGFYADEDGERMAHCRVVGETPETVAKLAVTEIMRNM